MKRQRITGLVVSICFLLVGCQKAENNQANTQVSPQKTAVPSSIATLNNIQALDLNIENLISSEYEALSSKPLPFLGEGSRIKISGNFDFMMKEAPVLDPEDPRFHEGNACEWHKQMAGIFMAGLMIASPNFTQLAKDLASATTKQIAIGDLLEKMIKSNPVTPDQVHITLNNAQTFLQRIRDFEPKTNGDKFIKPFLVKYLSDQIRIVEIILVLRERTALVKKDRLPEQLKDLASLMRKWADEIKLLIFQPSMSPDCVKMRKALWIALDKQAARIEYVLSGDAEKVIPLLEKLGADKKAGTALSLEKRPKEKLKESGEKSLPPGVEKELVLAFRLANNDKIREILTKYPSLLETVSISLPRGGEILELGFLHYAVYENDKELTKLLLKCDADVNSYCRSGLTPLHLAVVSADTDLGMVKILLENGADINKKEKKMGATPLFVGIVLKKTAVIRFLLENGADPSIEDDKGMSALELAQAFGYKEIVEMLLPKSIEK